MASTQVLPNSAASVRKQEHLEAGKRRLEEFRKKRAAEQAKKAAAPSQVQAADRVVNENQLVESELVKRLSDSDGAGTSNGRGGSYAESSSQKVKNDSHTVELFQKGEEISSDHHSFSSNNHEANSIDTTQPLPNFYEFSTHGASKFYASGDANDNHVIKQINNDSGIYSGAQVRVPDRTTSDSFIALRPQGSQDIYRTSSQSGTYVIDELQSKGQVTPLDKSIVTGSGNSDSFTRQSSDSSLPLNESDNTRLRASGNSSASYYDGFYQTSTNLTEPSYDARENIHGIAAFHANLSSDFGGQKLPYSSFNPTAVQAAAVQFSEPAGFSSNSGSSNQESLYSLSTDFSARRSRPSFLDSLGLSKPSSGSFSHHTEPEKDSSIFRSSNLFSNDVRGLSPFEKPTTEIETRESFSNIESQDRHAAFQDSNAFPFSSAKAADIKMMMENGGVDKRQEFHSSKQNEEFAALEQHIGDLTQEKFSLQRALETSRALAESLAAENSSLADNYNQQRIIVNQLKFDMETLQEEMKAQLVVLESVKLQCANAQLECNAADERAKILASEVIGLEEKALRLRSNELKLERQLENTEAEILSYKKKMSSLEKDRQDLHSTIEALQEEKKLLQSKLRKASVSGKSIVGNTSSKKDMSTSTDDLADEDVTRVDADNETESVASVFEVSSVGIPPDQMRMIQNINALLAELSLEKEELTQALASEISQNSSLKDMNKELSRKLEAQTQRLELLTAQSMAGERTPVRQPESHATQDDTPFADEGDEVVERVLGWIMKLFPGGPSKRRTSKLL